MTYLVMQIVICLLIAFILGFLLGWWLRGKRCEQDIGVLNRELREARSHGPDIEVDSERLARLERELDETRRREAERISELERLKASLNGDTDPPAEQGTRGRAQMDADTIDAVQPTLLEAPDGNPDDLKLISGIGSRLEQTLNRLGIWHYRQIASLSEENIMWINAKLRFKGRIQRERWVEQARTLADGGETESSARKK